MDAGDAPSFFALVLTEPSKAKLLNHVSSLLGDVHCHHSTLFYFRSQNETTSFECGDEVARAWDQLGPLVGTSYTCRANCSKGRKNDDVQAVPVRFDVAFLCTHPSPHVTVSGVAKKATNLCEGASSEIWSEEDDTIVDLEGIVTLYTVGGREIMTTVDYTAWKEEVGNKYAFCDGGCKWKVQPSKGCAWCLLPACLFTGCRDCDYSVSRERGCKWCGWHHTRTEEEGLYLRESLLAHPAGLRDDRPEELVSQILPNLYVCGLAGLEGFIALGDVVISVLDNEWQANAACACCRSVEAKWQHFHAVDDFTHLVTIHNAIPEFDEAVTYLDKCLRKDCRVIVHCAQGWNRSIAVVMCYLGKYLDYTFKNALYAVVDKRSSQSMNNPFMRLAVLRWFIENNAIAVLQLPIVCLKRVIQLLWIVEGIDQCIGIESKIFIAPSMQWWHALCLARKAGKKCAYVVYRRLSVSCTIDVFHRLQCGPPCRCRSTWRWRWLAFLVMKNRTLLCSSFVEWPIYHGQSKWAFHVYVVKAVRDAIPYHVFRYEDLLGIYKIPSRYLTFNEFEAVCDVLL
jgi:hypothetical protein